LQHDGRGGKLWHGANGTNLDNGYLNITFQKQLGMETLHKQTSLFTEDELTSSQEDFLANHTVKQESDLEKRMNATCGPKCLEQLKRFNHVGLWEKTFSALLIGREGWYSTKSKLTWKLRGTKYSRMYFQLVPSTPRIEETEFGLLPAPMAQTRAMPTQDQIQTRREKYGGDRRAMYLIHFAAMGRLPTPGAGDNRDRGGPKDKAIQRRIEIGKQVGLTMMVDGRLSSRFVEEMMGFPPGWTESPFQNGTKKQ